MSSLGSQTAAITAALNSRKATDNEGLYMAYRIKTLLFNVVGMIAGFILTINLRPDLSSPAGKAIMAMLAFVLPFSISAAWGFIAAKALKTKFKERYIEASKMICDRATRHLRFAAACTVLLMGVWVGLIK